VADFVLYQAERDCVQKRANAILYKYVIMSVFNSSESYWSNLDFDGILKLIKKCRC